MRTFGFVALVFVLCLHALKLEAANIYKVTSRDGGPTNAIALEGRIEDGDFNKYAALISKHPRLSGVLILHSPEGNLFEEIKIGTPTKHCYKRLKPISRKKSCIEPRQKPKQQPLRKLLLLHLDC